MRNTIALVALSALLAGARWNDAEAAPDREPIRDKDTLAAESTDIPEVIDVLTGRFDRFPPLYFTMRLDRVTKALADPMTPSVARLALLDEAGAACDRLGRGDAALQWMAEKEQLLLPLEAMPRLDVPADARYELLANRGAFRANRWLATGADRTRIAEVRAARADIAAAIALEPDAHSGRDKYLLAALDFVLDGGEAQRNQVSLPGGRTCLRAKGFLPIPAAIATSDQGDLSRIGFGDAAKGLPALVALHPAWENLDVVVTLRSAAEVQGRTSVAWIAERRLRELIDEGRRSLDPTLPTGASLVKRLGPAFVRPLGDVRPLDEWFAKARKAADVWVKARNDFAIAKLRAGKHPDTDPAFWDGFEAPRAAAAPSLPD